MKTEFVCVCGRGFELEVQHRLHVADAILREFPEVAHSRQWEARR